MARHAQESKVLIWSSVIVSFVVLLIATVLQTLYGPGQPALISKPVDSILFELAKQVSTAVLAAGTVGFAITAVMSKLTDSDEQRVAVMKREGIVNVFRNYNDPGYQALIVDLIRSAKSEIVFIGLGHGILVNHTNLLDEIQAVMLKHTVSTTILFADANLPGVQSRITEEAAAHQILKLGYNEEWIRYYPEEVRLHLQSNLSSQASARLRLGYLAFVPLLHYIRIDASIFLSPYGSPSQRGSASPVTFISKGDDGHYGKFLECFEQESLAKCKWM